LHTTGNVVLTLLDSNYSETTKMCSKAATPRSTLVLIHFTQH